MASGAEILKHTGGRLNKSGRKNATAVEKCDNTSNPKKRE
jgi:hypothetical protein